MTDESEKNKYCFSYLQADDQLLVHRFLNDNKSLARKQAILSNDYFSPAYNYKYN